MGDHWRHLQAHKMQMNLQRVMLIQCVDHQFSEFTEDPKNQESNLFWFVLFLFNEGNNKLQTVRLYIISKDFHVYDVISF